MNFSKNSFLVAWFLCFNFFVSPLLADGSPEQEAFCKAITDDNLETVKEYLSKPGVSVTSPCGTMHISQESPMASVRSKRVAEFLIKNGATIEPVGLLGIPLIVIPIVEGSPKDLIEFLIEKGADVNQAFDFSFDTFFEKNKDKEKFSTCKSVYNELRENMGAKDKFLLKNITPLMIAVLMKRLDIVEVLVNRGARVNEIGKITGTTRDLLTSVCLANPEEQEQLKPIIENINNYSGLLLDNELLKLEFSALAITGPIIMYSIFNAHKGLGIDEAAIKIQEFLAKKGARAVLPNIKITKLIFAVYNSLVDLRLKNPTLPSPQVLVTELLSNKKLTKLLTNGDANDPEVWLSGMLKGLYSSLDLYRWGEAAAVVKEEL